MKYAQQTKPKTDSKGVLENELLVDILLYF